MGDPDLGYYILNLFVAALTIPMSVAILFRVGCEYRKTKHKSTNNALLAIFAGFSLFGLCTSIILIAGIVGSDIGHDLSRIRTTFTNLSIFLIDLLIIQSIKEK